MSFTTENHPGVCVEPAAATSGFVFNHSMLRVKDPAVALDFYTRLLGLRVLRKLDFPEMKFSLYFLAHLSAAESVPEDAGERTAWTFSQRAVLELTHNWGTESTRISDITMAMRNRRGSVTSASRYPTWMLRSLGSTATRCLREAARPGKDEGRRIHQGSGRVLDRDCRTKAAEGARPLNSADAPPPTPAAMRCSPCAEPLSYYDLVDLRDRVRLPFRHISVPWIRLAGIQRPHRARLRSRHDLHVLYSEELRGDDRGRAERRIDLWLCALRPRSIRRIHRRLDDSARLLADTSLRVCLHGGGLGHAGAAGRSSVLDRGTGRRDARHQLVRRASDFQSQSDLGGGADRGARSAVGARSRCALPRQGQRGAHAAAALRAGPVSCSRASLRRHRSA